MSKMPGEFLNCQGSQEIKWRVRPRTRGSNIEDGHHGSQPGGSSRTRSESLKSFFRQQAVIRRGQTKMRLRWGLLWRDRASWCSAHGAAPGAGAHRNHRSVPPVGHQAPSIVFVPPTVPCPRVNHTLGERGSRGRCGTHSWIQDRREGARSSAV